MVESCSSMIKSSTYAWKTRRDGVHNDHTNDDYDDDNDDEKDDGNDDHDSDRKSNGAYNEQVCIHTDSKVSPNS